MAPVVAMWMKKEEEVPHLADSWCDDRRRKRSVDQLVGDEFILQNKSSIYSV